MNRQYQKIRDHFKRVDPIIHSAMEDLDFDDWLKQSKSRTKDIDYFRALCREIIRQQLSGKAAGAILSRFNKLFKNGKPNPIQILNTSNQKLRDVGMSWAKVKYVKNIADAYINKTVQFNELNNLSDEDIISQLISIKGIGSWTAEMFLIFTLGREDVFSYGDLGLRKGFSKLYKIENPTQKQIEKVISKWIPFRTYGSITLWHTLDSEVFEASKKMRE